MMQQVWMHRSGIAVVYVDAATPEEARRIASDLVTDSDFTTEEWVRAYDFTGTPPDRWYSIDAGWTWPEQPLGAEG